MPFVSNVVCGVLRFSLFIFCVHYSVCTNYNFAFKCFLIVNIDAIQLMLSFIGVIETGVQIPPSITAEALQGGGDGMIDMIDKQILHGSLFIINTATAVGYKCHHPTNKERRSFPHDECQAV